jgi:pyridoxamine 5'-phosphate oxidase
VSRRGRGLRYAQTHVTPDLASIYERAWAMLQDGVADRRHGFHTPAVCTLSELGPTARTVVLRRVERVPGVVMAHTDRRSPKVMEVERAPRSTWHLYDSERQVQLRLFTRSRAEHDTTLADEQWARSALSSRRCYLAPHGPSTELAAFDPNLPEALRKRTPTLEETLAGRANFCVLVGVIEQLEFLELSAGGHARARFTLDGAGGMARGAWLAG